MAFWDKVKETAGKAAETAKNSFEKIKESNEQRKEEKQAHIEAMEQECKAFSEEVIEKIIAAYDGTKPGLFGPADFSEVEKFMKSYYEMLVLPGSRPNISCLTMKPYIDEKTLKKLTEKKALDLDGSEPAVYIKDSNVQDIVITPSVVSFRFKFEKDKNFNIRGAIPVDKINSFEIEIGESEGKVLINGVQLTTIPIKGSYRQDFMSLNYFFECVSKCDFAIDTDEVDSQIRAKIGDKIYAQVKKYFIDEDEKLLFYAGGIDSLTAVDYIVCTNNQLIFVNREMLGATANVKQFYYEDVTSMATIQNSQSTDLLGAVIDTALTAAMKICTLQVAVAGAKENINVVYLVEATRIIAIYHEMRKNAKKAAAEPVQVVNQSGPDVLEQIQKLAQLKEAGILSEEEFAAKKAELLAKL